MAGKKKRVPRAERERLREQRTRREQDAVVEDTTARVGCTADTAGDMIAQCESRLDDIESDLTFAGLALDVWRDRLPGRQLAPLIEELIAEQRRHGAAMDSIAQRLVPIAEGEHEHLADDEVDPAWVRQALFTPPEDRPLDRQIPTISGRR